VGGVRAGGPPLPRPPGLRGGGCPGWRAASSPAAGWRGGGVPGGRAAPPPASISGSYRVAFSLNDIGGLLHSTDASLTACCAAQGRLPTGCWVVGWKGRRVARRGGPGGKAASSPAAAWRVGGVRGDGRPLPRHIRPRHNHLSSERKTNYSLSGKVGDSIGLEALFLFRRRSVSPERLPYGQIGAVQMG